VSALLLARDVKTLIGWLNHDVLELAGPVLAERQELYDFVVAELQLREGIGGKKMRVLRKALQNQRDDILGFAQVLDDKLADIAQQLKMPLHLVREMCLLFPQTAHLQRLLASLESALAETIGAIPSTP